MKSGRSDRSTWSVTRKSARPSDLVRLHAVLEDWRRETRPTPWLLNAYERAQSFLPELVADHSATSPGRFAEIAEALSPANSVHQRGELTNLLWRARNRCRIPLDPTLFAALHYSNWHAGKVGFAFLPDPASALAAEYRILVRSLISDLDAGVRGDPLRLLVDGEDGNDAAFYRSLPDRVTIWRGAFGISPEIASVGVCWTTRREIAEWFATRRGREPVVVCSTVAKSWVRLAKATEFEVVGPGYELAATAVSCPPEMVRPDRMTWMPHVEAEEIAP